MSETSAKRKKSLQFKCPSCGANLRFSPKHGQLYCEHCDCTVTVSRDKNVRERDFSELTNFTKWSDSEVACYVCHNCGAHSVLPRVTVATTCPYCNSHVVIDKENLGTVKPDTVIPFEVDTTEARDSILKWRKKRFFAPNSFKKHLEIESIHGVYMPIWTFDCYTNSRYSGRLGKRKTRTVRRNGKTYTETYIDWFHVSGTKKNIFDDIIVRANNTVSESTFNKLAPYPQQKYVVYSDEYLAGYIADNYTVEPKQAFNIAENRIREIIKNEILLSYHADVVGHMDVDIFYDAKSFKYLFVPMYVTATQFHSKTYTNYVSGIPSGRKGDINTTGTAPKSVWKIGLLVLLILALIAGIVIGLMASGIVQSVGSFDWEEFDWGDFDYYFNIVPPLQTLTQSLL